jgi:hypothetical protein
MKKIIVILFLCSTSILSAQKASQDFFSELGFNVVVSKNLAKRYSDSSELFSSLLKTNGLDDVGKIQKLVLEKTGNDYSTISEVEKEKLIVFYLKQNPDLAKQILKQIPSFRKKVINEMTLEQIIPDKSIISSLNSIFSTPRNRLTALKPDIEELKNVLMTIPAIKKNYSEGNVEVVELIDGLNELLKSIE